MLMMDGYYGYGDIQHTSRKPKIIGKRSRQCPISHVPCTSFLFCSFSLRLTQQLKQIFHTPLQRPHDRWGVARFGRNYGGRILGLCAFFPHLTVPKVFVYVMNVILPNKRYGEGVEMGTTSTPYTSSLPCKGWEEVNFKWRWLCFLNTITTVVKLPRNKVKHCSA